MRRVSFKPTVAAGSEQLVTNWGFLYIHGIKNALTKHAIFETKHASGLRSADLEL